MEISRLCFIAPQREWDILVASSVELYKLTVIPVAVATVAIVVVYFPELLVWGANTRWVIQGDSKSISEGEIKTKPVEHFKLLLAPLIFTYFKIFSSPGSQLAPASIFSGYGPGQNVSGCACVLVWVVC